MIVHDYGRFHGFGQDDDSGSSWWSDLLTTTIKTGGTVASAALTGSRATPTTTPLVPSQVQLPGVGGVSSTVLIVGGIAVLAALFLFMKK